MPSPHSVEPEPALPATVSEQHRAIREVVARLQRATDLLVVAALLQELDGMLRAHFIEEERPGGLIDAIGSSAAPQHRELARIMVDHRALEVSTKQAMRATQECIEGPVEQVLRLARRLCDEIVSHEQRETQAALAAIAAESVAGTEAPEA